MKTTLKGNICPPDEGILLLLGYLRRAHSLQVQQRSGRGPAVVLNCGSFVATLKLDYHMLFATN